jgi:hypothetical protein
VAPRIARLVGRFRGPLAEEVVLPWALPAVGADEIVEALESFDTPSTRVADPLEAITELRQIADDLAMGAWGVTPDQARRRVSEIARRVRAGDVAQALGTLDAAAQRPRSEEVDRLLAVVDGLGRLLQARGVLPVAELVWQLDLDELERVVGELQSTNCEGVAVRPTLRGGPDRWEPFLVETTFGQATVHRGTPINGGVGAGRLHAIADLRGIGRPAPRSILAAPAPLPHLAPLLWHCAGFVARTGSAGAHLFEVARSLGVPAVVGLDLGALGPPGSLAAIDGATGEVAVLDGAGHPPVALDRAAPGSSRRPA